MLFPALIHTLNRDAIIDHDTTKNYTYHRFHIHELYADKHNHNCAHHILGIMVHQEDIQQSIVIIHIIPPCTATSWFISCTLLTSMEKTVYGLMFAVKVQPLLYLAHIVL